MVYFAANYDGGAWSGSHFAGRNFGSIGRVLRRLLRSKRIKIGGEILIIELYTI